MTIEPRFTTYIISTFAGYWLAFVASATVVAVVESEMVLALIPVFFFSLFIAIGVSLISSIIGYPSFRYLYKKLAFSAIPKLFLAGGFSCLVSVLGFALAFNYLIGGVIELNAIIQTSLGILTFCILVVPLSVLVYWLIER
ncbi:MAG: hypothetical protein ABJV04_13200 [Aliiglaciecola sp.]|uniref:hypothetical protein n=1 Tax=Aliiglaciecola sp. TaxID=1872441 RepID=UPI00329A557F